MVSVCAVLALVAVIALTYSSGSVMTISAMLQEANVSTKYSLGNLIKILFVPISICILVGSALSLLCCHGPHAGKVFLLSIVLVLLLWIALFNDLGSNNSHEAAMAVWCLVVVVWLWYMYKHDRTVLETLGSRVPQRFASTKAAYRRVQLLPYVVGLAVLFAGSAGVGQYLTAQSIKDNPDADDEEFSRVSLAKEKGVWYNAVYTATGLSEYALFSCVFLLAVMPALLESETAKAGKLDWLTGGMFWIKKSDNHSTTQ